MIKESEIKSSEMNDQHTTRHPENYKTPAGSGGGAVVPKHDKKSNNPEKVKLTIKRKTPIHCGGATNKFRGIEHRPYTPRKLPREWTCKERFSRARPDRPTSLMRMTKNVMIKGLDGRFKIVRDYRLVSRALIEDCNLSDDMTLRERLLIDDLAFIVAWERETKEKILNHKAQYTLDDLRDRNAVEAKLLAILDRKLRLIDKLGWKRVNRTKNLDQYLEEQFGEQDKHSGVCEGSGVVGSEPVTRTGVVAESDLRTTSDS